MSKLLEPFGILRRTDQIESNSIDVEDVCYILLAIFFWCSTFTIVCCLFGGAEN